MGSSPCGGPVDVHDTRPTRRRSVHATIWRPDRSEAWHVCRHCPTLLPNSVYAAGVKSSLLRWVVRVRCMGVLVHHA